MMQLRSALLVIVVVSLSPAVVPNNACDILSCSGNFSFLSCSKMVNDTGDTLSCSGNFSFLSCSKMANDTCDIGNDFCSMSWKDSNCSDVLCNFDTVANCSCAVMLNLMNKNDSVLTLVPCPMGDPSALGTTGGATEDLTLSEIMDDSLGSPSPSETTVSPMRADSSTGVPSLSGTTGGSTGAPSPSGTTGGSTGVPSASGTTGGSTGVPSPSGTTGGSTGPPPVSYALLYAGCVLTITCLLPVVLFFTVIRYVYCDLCKSGLAMLSTNAKSFYLLFFTCCVASTCSVTTPTWSTPTSPSPSC